MCLLLVKLLNLWWRTVHSSLRIEQQVIDVDSASTPASVSVIASRIPSAEVRVSGSLHTTRVYGPWSLVSSTGVILHTLLHGPCRRAVFTGSVDRRPSTRSRNTGVQNDTRAGYPCLRLVSTGGVYRACVATDRGRVEVLLSVSWSCRTRSFMASDLTWFLLLPIQSFVVAGWWRVKIKLLNFFTVTDKTAPPQNTVWRSDLCPVLHYHALYAALIRCYVVWFVP